ncbi:cation diffusion facilitator family transporter [Nocardioides renjunii]|uniref:cation diffusion facilitator family transporter n=1 Tax=Nocardioides renjunii TaxID=3095075 RepID=UPI002AFFA765|nr:cation diffusion facilitator family transporter [Nocardioides sp. S-34]WQQ22516.1 cation diffusion facilitator family transporter [Nocardioides sp. S-34]
MGSGHGHTHAGARHRWRLAVAFGLVAAFFVVELVAGLLSGSLALLSDAGHMAADVVALGAALVATSIATRPDTTGRRTYGSYRAEVLASGFTVLLMLGVSAYVVVEAVRRAGTAVEVSSGPMLVVGAVGLLVNLVCLGLLRGGAQESINVRGAYLEVVADAAGSVGVLAAGMLVALTGASWWDTAVAVAIGAFVAVRALVLGREVLAVLGQHAPHDVDLAAVVRDLERVPGVAEVHDLHAWTLTSGMNVATAHLVVCVGAEPQAVLTAAQATLREGHGMEHATLQVEAHPARECHAATW